MPLFFTPAQADEVLPEVRKTVLQIMRLKKSSERLSDETQIASETRRLEGEIGKLEDLGCVLKDWNTGLIDFPAVRLGARVWLCWRSGEAKIEFWHGVHEGFASRKPVKDDEFYPDDLAIRALAGEIPKLTQEHLEFLKE